MDSLCREIINQYQGNLPLVKHPFAAIARKLNTDQSTVIDCIKRLLSSKLLSRFGPIYNADCLGGGLTLAAISVAENDFSTVSNLINSLPQVAHNYRRDHKLNMWFVLATETPEEIQECIQSLQRLTGLKVYNFPKLEEFYLGLRLFISNDDQVSTGSFKIDKPQTGYKTNDLDRSIIQATQNGLILVPEPYEAIANEIGSYAEEVVKRIQTMLDYGVIRRIGVVPNHYMLGLTHNGMSVWDVDDDRISDLGRILGRLDFVSHSYRRPRYKSIWPYNLFAMVHGRSRIEVIEKVEQISNLLGDNCRQSDVLFSSAILKKSGLRLVA
ncbi:MAG: Lrp/AsnC family transcriptional regulator [Gammaproteobacteria bacterium]|nr:Lrp/AsnC family transcriptional regulator [Gammaproteobacteria bacterium]